MPWFIGLDSMVVVEDNEASTEAEAIEAARLKIMEWLGRVGDPTIEMDWNIEHETI